jgi:hypothetical protein
LALERRVGKNCKRYSARPSVITTIFLDRNRCTIMISTCSMLNLAFIGFFAQKYGHYSSPKAKLRRRQFWHQMWLNIPKKTDNCTLKRYSTCCGSPSSTYASLCNETSASTHSNHSRTGTGAPSQFFTLNFKLPLNMKSDDSSKTNTTVWSGVIKLV